MTDTSKDGGTAFPSALPAAPTPTDPEMRPVNIDRLIEATRAKSLLGEEVK